ncbi:PLP-dependent aminotransferase family protein [Paenibacillus aurantius]|uniref:PLP-dependent aminotransferase family protein n=1 Tax=Paenibacillus aurantius TaxID=2918900 RepID=A0AA96RGT3_9BACL|nr:PLP-dependent aminotransferase family protein [Paenibacillus aurantius]WNQ12821.1 PLP-dependent aminotransferase family protein [Paenibacillus aurantius]
MRKQHRTKSLALYHALKEAMTAGTVGKGTRLPSSRELAALYGLSRGTVNEVYDMLSAEGYVESVRGSGTFAAYEGSNPAQAQERREEIRLSAWGKRAAAQPDRWGPGGNPARISLTPGMPDLTLFPYAEWNRALHAQVRERADSPEGDPEGFYPLREMVARHLRRARGMTVEAGDVVIVNGSMQAIALLTQLLVDEGDPVVVENPGYGGIHAAVRTAGGRLLAAPVDDRGLRVEDWDARLLFVTPGRHFPTGAVLPLVRRQQLLEWAGRRKAVIVEDDYDSEFRHRGRPIEPLKLLDREGRVVFIGTFSKTMLPGLRIGYAVLPPGLKEAFVRAKQLYEPFPSGLLEQRALAAFLQSGHYERHLRRMKRVYSRKFALLEEELRNRLGFLFEPVPSDSGLHLFAWWKGSAEEFEAFRRACAEEGVRWSGTEGGFLEGYRPSALFGFSHLSEAELAEAVEIMARTGSAVLLRRPSGSTGPSGARGQKLKNYQSPT